VFEVVPGTGNGQRQVGELCCTMKRPAWEGPSPIPLISSYICSTWIPNKILLQLTHILLPCIDPGWLSSTSFLFCWQTLSSQCKHLNYAASCILSCCSIYLQFTSFTDLIVTKELHAFALQTV